MASQLTAMPTVATVIMPQPVSLASMQDAQTNDINRLAGLMAPAQSAGSNSQQLPSYPTQEITLTQTNVESTSATAAPGLDVISS